jgi:TolB-like protein
MQEAADKIAKDFATKKDLKNKRIVVIGFKGLSNSDALSPIIESELTTSFIKIMPGKIVARIYMDEILQELQFSNTDIFSEENRKQIGLLSSAEVIVSGTYRLEKSKVALTVQAIDIETGIALASTKVEIKKYAVPINNEPTIKPVKIKPIKSVEPVELPVFDLGSDFTFYLIDKFPDVAVGGDISTNYYFSKYFGVGLGLEILQVYADYDEELITRKFMQAAKISRWSARTKTTFALPYLSLLIRYKKEITLIFSGVVGEHVGNWRVGAKYDYKNIVCGLALSGGHIAGKVIDEGNPNQDPELLPPGNKIYAKIRHDVSYQILEFTIGYRIPILSKLWN